MSQSIRAYRRGEARRDATRERSKARVEARRPPDTTRPVPSPLVSATANAFEAKRQVIAINGTEYCLGKDGDVLHRMIGNVTFLDPNNPGRLTHDEKLALEMLR